MMYSVQAQVEYSTPDGYTLSRSLPTFYVDGWVTGDLTEEQAERTAKSVVDPFDDHICHISVLEMP